MASGASNGQQSQEDTTAHLATEATRSAPKKRVNACTPYSYWTALEIK
jgi:hypothetical protein